MIASVVVSLDVDKQLQQKTLAEISARPDMELGMIDAATNRLPVTIESLNRREMGDATEWLKTLQGALFVDVVFVHFEEESGVG